MSGVFLSYSRGDRALAERVLKGLRGLGAQVWWDEDMPGVDWQEELARQISELAAVLVLWTPLSADSKNVRDEARLGQHTDKLVNVLVGVAAPPFPFDRINGLPLDSWTGREPHNGWTRVVATVEDHLVAAGAARPGELTAALASREAGVRRLTQAFADKEEAFQAAKAEEAAAGEAAAAAQAQFAAADEQMRRVAEIARGPALLRAAQSELDSAAAAKDAAEQARKAAAATLATASRAYARARTELERMFDTPPPAPPAGPRRSEPASPKPAPARAAPPPPTPPAPKLATEGFAKRRPNTALIAGLITAATGVIVVTLIATRQTPAPPARSDPGAAMSAAITNTVIAETTNAIPRPVDAPAASAAADPPPATWLAGRWLGVGGSCTSPLVIGVSGQTISLANMGQTSSGQIEAVEGPEIATARWPDGVWTYARIGDTLTMSPPRGRNFVYTRCAG